ncbi:MAG: hypothetical protein PHD15_05165 [Clostridia bacterium]|nr:hypothetical protein [Clostridia bacterium]MDD4387124.1 hypothetical protein [Clostridia bacterium]
MSCNKEFDRKENDCGQDVGEVCFKVKLTPSCKKPEPCCQKPEPCCQKPEPCCPRCVPCCPRCRH